MEHFRSDANAALRKLVAGNMEYMRSKTTKSDISQASRDAVVHRQRPYAVVITCSDSRVIPEKIFMTEIGDLFTIRVAGNIIGNIELGSIELAVNGLETKLIMLMGHSRCGAVNAAISNECSGNIKILTDAIKDAIGNETDHDKGVRMNILHGLNKIKNSPMIKNNESLLVIGGYYHTNTGRVEILKSEPRRKKHSV